MPDKRQNIMNNFHWKSLKETCCKDLQKENKLNDLGSLVFEE